MTGDSNIRQQNKAATSNNKNIFSMMVYIFFFISNLSV
jgi:hypothetical protein